MVNADNLKTFNPAASIGVAQGLELSPIQKKGLRHFRRQNSYFGALYVSKNGTSFQSFINWHSLDRVKQAARKGCEVISKDTCVLAAVSVPKGLDPNAKNLHGLGSWAAHDIKDYKNRQVEGGYGAFAVSGSAHQGYSHNWPNEAEAREAALAYCKIGVVKDLAPLGIEGRKFSHDHGYDKCHVIHVTHPN
jgi:hypothetical protein